MAQEPRLPFSFSSSVTAPHGGARGQVATRVAVLRAEGWDAIGGVGDAAHAKGVKVGEGGVRAALRARGGARNTALMCLLTRYQ